MSDTNHASRTYLRTLIAISAVLVLATLILRFGRGLVLAPLNLTNENVLAAWFSGILLFLASLHAADGYFRLRNTNLKAALAWWVIAAMLLFMSADEIGSLHERIDDVVHMGAWLSFLPFLVVLLGACAWSFLQLWITPSERRFVPGLILGFAILVSVGGQEFLEKAFKWPWYLGPLRSAFEEGSELTAMIILIYTTLRNSTGLFNAQPAQGPAFSSVPMLRWVLVIAAAAIAWPVAQLSSVLDNQASVGHPSDWLSCALFFLAAVLLIARWCQSSERGRFPTSAVAFLAAASAICVQVDPIGDNTIFPFTRSMTFFDLELNVRLMLLALCCLGAAEALRGRGVGYRTGATLMAIAGVLTAMIAGYTPTHALAWGYFATTLSGVVAFTALTLTPAPAVEARASANELSAPARRAAG